MASYVLCTAYDIGMNRLGDLTLALDPQENDYIFSRDGQLRQVLSRFWIGEGLLTLGLVLSAPIEPSNQIIPFHKTHY